MKRLLLILSCLFILMVYSIQVDPLNNLVTDGECVLFYLPNNFNFTLSTSKYFYLNHTHIAQMHTTSMTDDSTAMLFFARCFECKSSVVVGSPDYYIFDDIFNQLKNPSLVSSEPVQNKDTFYSLDTIRSTKYNTSNFASPPVLIRYIYPISAPVITSLNETMLVVYITTDYSSTNTKYNNIFASYYNTKTKTWSPTHRLWSQIGGIPPSFSSVHVDYPYCAIVTDTGKVCYFKWQEENSWNCDSLNVTVQTYTGFNDKTHNIRISSNKKGDWLVAAVVNQTINVFSAKTRLNNSAYTLSPWSTVAFGIASRNENIKREFVTVAYTKIAWFVAWCETEVVNNVNVSTIRYAISKIVNNDPLDFALGHDHLGKFQNMTCDINLQFLKLHPASLDSYPLYMFLSVGTVVNNYNYTWSHSVRLVERIGNGITDYTYYLTNNIKTDINQTSTSCYTNNNDALTFDYDFYEESVNICFDFEPYYSIKNETVIVTKTLNCDNSRPDSSLNKGTTVVILFGNIPIDSEFKVEEQLNNVNIISTPEIPITRTIVVVGPTLINNQTSLTNSNLQISGSLKLTGSNVTIQNKTTLNVTGDLIVNENSYFYFDDSVISVGGCLNFTGTLVITKEVIENQILDIANYSSNCDKPDITKISGYTSKSGKQLCPVSGIGTRGPTITSLIIQFNPCDPTTPSNPPTRPPTNSPPSPTNSPTNIPTNSPTNSPTNIPTNSPTNSPTISPTNSPIDTTPPDELKDDSQMGMIIGLSVAAAVVFVFIVIGLLVFFVKPVREVVMPFKNQNKFMNNKKETVIEQAKRANTESFAKSNATIVPPKSAIHD